MNNQDFFPFVNFLLREYNEDFVFSPKAIEVSLDFTEGERPNDEIFFLFFSDALCSTITMPFTYDIFEDKLRELVFDKLQKLWEYGYSFFVQLKQILFSTRNSIFVLRIIDLNSQIKKEIVSKIQKHFSNELGEVIVHMSIYIANLKQRDIPQKGNLHITVSYTVNKLL